MTLSGALGAPAEDLTVLLTDIENSTWLWEHHPDDMATVLVEHNELMARAIDPAGVFVKSTGDGVLAVFRDASDAVATAVDIQRRVDERPWPGIGRLRVRVGINSGPCRLTRDDVIGRPPNLAARLQTAGHGGQILTSGTTAARCAGRLRSDIELVDLGQYTMRGFDDPVEVHSVRAAGLQAEFPPLRAAYRGFEDLPLEDEGPLIGRDGAIDDATGAVRAHRLVTLWGPAGVGKTRLALRVANASRHAFDDGVRFVDVSASSSEHPFVDALLAALRAQPALDEAPLDTVVRAVQELRLLLVCDNCEGELDEVGHVVAAMVAANPSLHVLTTSRQPLGIDGEHTMVVAPLPVQLLDADRIDVARIAEVDAVRLFVTRLVEGRPQFRLTEATVDAVRRVCRATGGLPYAIELDAARAAVEGLDVVDASIASAGSPSRSSANEGALAQRLSRVLSSLDPSALELCTRLAVFAGPVRRELAATVAADRSTFDRDLATLVRAAVIHYDDQDGTYRMLAPVRSIAWRRLSASEQEAVAMTRSATMVSRAEQLEPVLRTQQQVAAVSTLKDELAEHAAAFEHLMATGAVGEAARLVCALFQFGLFQPRPEVQRWAATVAHHLPADDPRAADVLGASALAAWYTGDTETAVDLGLQAVAAEERTAGSARWGRTALIDALGYAGRLDEATPHYLALVSGLGRDPDPYWRVNGIGLEAVSLAIFGRHDAGRRRATEALALARRTGNPDCLHWGLYAMGRTLTVADPLAACEAFEQAMRWSRSVDSRFNVGIALVEWVALKRQLGERPAAVVGALDLLELLAVSGQRSQLSQALRVGGLLLADAGRADAAAVALLGRRGLPALPTAWDPTDPEVDVRLADLEVELGTSWGRVSVIAQALSEPELVERVRDTLRQLQARRSMNQGEP